MIQIAYGIFRFWLDDDGWGIIDSPDTPGGCFAHFSTVDMTGYVALPAGQYVQFGAEPMEIEGVHWSATSVTPIDPRPTG